MTKKKITLRVLLVSLFLLFAFFFTLPTLLATIGIGGLYSEDRISKVEVIKSFFYGGLDELKYSLGMNFKKTQNLEIQVSFINLKIFENLIKKAQDAQMLSEETKKWIPAKLHIDGETYQINFRLRGDLPRHYTGRKISLRIKIKGDKLWKGKKDLVLINPLHSGYIVDTFLGKIAKKFSITNNHASLVNLSLNGSKLGSFVQLERYDMVLLEKQNQSYSSIFKIDESQFASLNKNKKREYEYIFDENIIYSASMWKSRTKKIEYTDQHRDSLHKVFSLLKKNSLIDNHIYEKLSYHLDMESFAWQSVFNIFFGAHLDAPHNTMLYFDNTTAQFRPLLVDPNYREFSVDKLDKGNLKFNFQVILNRLTTNQKFVNLRDKKLKVFLENKEDIIKIFGEVFEDSKRYFISDNLLEGRSFRMRKLGPFMTGPLLYLSYYDLKYSLDKNFDEIEKYLKEKRKIFNHVVEQKNYKNPLVTILLKRSKSETEIITNHNQSKKINFNSIEVSQYKIKHNFNLNITPMLKIENSFLKFSKIQEDDEVVKWKLIIDKDILNQEQNFIFKSQFNEKFFNFRFDFQIDQKSLSDNRIIISQTNSQDNTVIPYNKEDFLNIITEFSNIEFNLLDNVIVFKKGDFQVNKTIIIPKNYKLYIPAGTKISFAENTWLVSYSIIEIDGEENAPVIFAPLNKVWNGLIVLQTDQNRSQKSSINYMIFKGGDSGYFNGINSTGALVFNVSGVEINNSIFINSGLDDSINIKRSNFLLENNIFINATSDAVDIDWSDGKIINNLFINSGGDGIDISGTNSVEISQNVILFSEDKGISVGENSKIKISKNLVYENKYGIVSKDLSKIYLNSNLIVKNKIGIAAYQKKPFFGPASILASENTFYDNQQKQFIDNYSKILNKNESLDFKVSNLNNKDFDEIMMWLGNIKFPNNLTFNIEKWKKQLELN